MSPPKFIGEAVEVLATNILPSMIPSPIEDQLMQESDTKDSQIS